MSADQPLAFEQLQLACSHDLPHARRTASDGPIDLDEMTVELARGHRVQGVLWHAVAAGVFTGAACDVAHQRAIEAIEHTLLVRSSTAAAVRALRDAGVETRVLKGVAMARLDYAEPSARMFADGDLLIRRSQHGAAVRALADAGFERTRPPVRAWWERRYGKGFVVDAPPVAPGAQHRLIEIDIHIALTTGEYGYRLDHEPIWSTPGEPFDLGDVGGVALDAPWRLVHACCHAVLGGGSGLRVARDVAQLALVGAVDPTAFADLVEDAGLGAVAALAITQSWELLDLAPDDPFATWARQRPVTDADRRSLARYDRSHTDGGWAREGRGILDALSPGDRLLFLAGLAWPSRGNLAARGRSRREQLTRLWNSR